MRIQNKQYQAIAKYSITTNNIASGLLLHHKAASNVKIKAISFTIIAIKHFSLKIFSSCFTGSNKKHVPTNEQILPNVQKTANNFRLCQSMSVPTMEVVKPVIKHIAKSFLCVNQLKIVASVNSVLLLSYSSFVPNVDLIPSVAFGIFYLSSKERRIYLHMSLLVFFLFFF